MVLPSGNRRKRDTGGHGDTHGYCEAQIRLSVPHIPVVVVPPAIGHIGIRQGTRMRPANLEARKSHASRRTHRCGHITVGGRTITQLPRRVTPPTIGFVDGTQRTRMIATGTDGAKCDTSGLLDQRRSRFTDQ